MTKKPCNCGDPMSGAKIYVKRPIKVFARQMDRDFIVNTLEGLMRGKAGDYLVLGIKGERYPVRKDIFEETYDFDPASSAFNTIPVRIDSDG